MTLSQDLRRSLLALFFFGGLAGWMAWSAYGSAVDYETRATLLAAQAEPNAQLRRAVKRWLGELPVFPLEGYGDELRALDAQRKAAAGARRDAHVKFLGFVAAATAGVLLAYAARRRRSTIVVGLLVASLIALVVGLLAPAMALTAAQEVPAVGKVVLYFESRGILSTILALLGPHGSYAIGIPILLFSVLLPLAKTAVMGVAAVSSGRLGSGVLSLVHRIGKWSMADVCLTGWILAFLASEHQRFMSAELQVGTLFFACYAVLSILAGQWLEPPVRPATAPDHTPER